MTDPNATPEPDALISVSLSAVADEEDVTASTVQRWITRGLRLPSGERVKLRAIIARLYLKRADSPGARTSRQIDTAAMAARTQKTTSAMYR